VLDVVWGPLAAVGTAGLLASWLLETGLQPRPVAPWRRPGAALGVHAGVWAVTFALALALLGRPYLAAANALALLAVLVIVNNAKFQSLREPFVYADFVFFTDALRHPRLYLPFLGWRLPLGVALAYGVAMWAGVTVESAPRVSVVAYAVVLAVLGAMLAWWSARRLPVSPQFDAGQDMQHLGLLAALWQYARAERADTEAIRAASPFAHYTLPKKPAVLPDLLVIQSESFFDPRRAYPQICAQIRPDLLAHYDTLRAEALHHGEVRVDAWGANTVRSEFAFLSGMAPNLLGVHRFHPYRRLARQGVATLASTLRGLGYRCVCVHPYHGSFYGRNKVLPALGFDDFIDIRAFGAAEHAGPYVSDLALADHVQALLAQHDAAYHPAQPLYLHLITMENHGPLHWERVSEADVHAVWSAPLPPDGEEFIAYLRHLRNADAMFGRLRQCLLGRACQPNPRPAALCLFGDHVPIMPSVYHQWGAPDAVTDYLIWHTDAQPVQRSPATPLSIHQLAQCLLAASNAGAL